MAEEFLPKPELDLPLPEKELSSGEETAQPIVHNENLHPEDHSHRLKYFTLGFLVVAIIALIGGGGYFLGVSKSSISKNQQTVTTQVSAPSPTLESIDMWQTYTNNKWDYSFKYPSFLKVADGNNIKSLDYVQFQSEPDSYKYRAAPSFQVDQLSAEIADNDPGGFKAPGFNASDLWPLEKVGDKSKYGTVRLSDIEISGNTARVYDANNFKEILIKKNGIYYRIMMWKGILKAEKLNKNYELSDQILSTFKFTDTKEASNSSDSKTVNPTPVPNPNLNTYKNDTYNFSFQYPKDFVVNKNSTKDSVSFLQKQDDLMAQRVLAYVDPNKENLSLDEYTKKNTLDATETKAMKISGHDAILISKTFNLKKECGSGEDAQITRTKALIIKIDEGFLTFNNTDSCKTYETDWFSQIIPTIYFNN